MGRERRREFARRRRKWRWRGEKEKDVEKGKMIEKGNITEGSHGREEGRNVKIIERKKKGDEEWKREIGGEA